jgi:nitrate/TMAO reductase-like tetraheme cytochrome c subunit
LGAPEEKTVNDSNDPTENGYFRNWLSIAGACLMLASLFGGLLFAAMELLSGAAAAYAGLLYVVCTGLIVVGFLLIPAGALLERRRRKSGRHSRPLTEFRFDLRDREHRRGALAVIAGAVLVLTLFPVGAYKSFHATESIEFCGQLCHEVMEPEWVRYHDSSHARVACVECHIGAGADWFVRSKLSGLRQIWAVTVDSFPRPIPTPIRDLRPARETCEECHWRRKFIGYKEISRAYFLSDEENTLHQLRMLVKIGGEKTTFMRGSGIHYHMLIASEIEYIATDDRRQEIAWVRVARGDGSVTEFERLDEPLTHEEKSTLEVRTMDCIDCHNRPSHQFPAPMELVNDALGEGSISRELPSIKVQAVQALDDGYETSEAAMIGIANSMRDFYRSDYPEVFAKKSDALTTSIKKVQSIYRETIFPEMKANWSVYPDNIGHRDSPGCFRCHNDELESADGQTIFTTCNKCHLILAQGESIEQVNVDLETGLPFIHPEDYETIEEYTECTDCHTGGAAVYE